MGARTRRHEHVDELTVASSNIQYRSLCREVDRAIERMGTNCQVAMAQSWMGLGSSYENGLLHPIIYGERA